MTVARVGLALLVAVGMTFIPERHAAADRQAPSSGAKGGDDRNGAYDAVPNWWKPAPDHDATWTWGEVSGLAAETPDRIIVAIWGDRNRQGVERPNGSNYLVVVNRHGDIVERWQQWDGSSTSRTRSTSVRTIRSATSGSSSAAAAAASRCRSSSSPTTARRS